ncbi:proline dehydrogenase family protein [Sanguibacter antarcticus]|uniref:L-glutamate gamma-semialdehyde dehydrogenase n=1 Tax=Sanguibacter antarcticus TaxID=372484 RepID=A0A2A9E8W9_9MICO|nr:bifunctional proline dehydrogenase/L-glutamate gamma-semialdehyde dehydrogenase [Sanguibacter antarcticus]PFG34669.1 L-proline dehydrogenase [Sanguibacter antarcticus]
MTRANPRSTSLPAVTGTDAESGLAEESVALVRRWLAEASELPVDGSAAQLAGALGEPGGLDFVVGFVDGVIRPEDDRVAAHALVELSRSAPRFLPAPMRAALRLGGVVAPILPGVVVPVARRVLREMVGHLVIDASDNRLGPAIARVRQDGVRLNVNLLGEAVLGRREADNRLEGTLRLLSRDDVDYVSVKVSSTVPPHSPWAFDESVVHIVERLHPLFLVAARSPAPKFINLDMEDYKDLDLTIAVFTRLLDSPDLLDLEAGIVLQAYLPDALSAMVRIQDWAADRRSRGGAAVKVRLVKGANLPMEQVEAEVHGWPLATWGTKQETDTHYKRVLRYALHPDRTANVRIGVAGHNLFDVAYAWLLAGRRGVRAGIEFEMLLGMAQGQAEAVRREVGSLLLYTPVVAPREFDVAIAYLIRRLEEGASTENFMSAVFELDSDPVLFARERDRFLASLSALDGEPADHVPAARRSADRYAAIDVPGPGRFVNTPDTDPAVEANRTWGREILGRVAGSTLGAAAIDAARVTDPAALDALITGLREGTWGSLSAQERAAVLHRAGELLEARRADLLEVMASEAGKTLDQGDPEVSEAIDFAHFYAERGLELAHVDGARFVPARVTLVTPPWNFPVAIPAGSTLAALAAGSAVVLKPAQEAERCGAVLAEILWEAGVPRDALQLVQVDESTLGQTLIAHPHVDRVILTGAYETAELFRTFRPDLPLLAEASGKNSIIVTPSADLDLAVRDVVASAFGHAGQKCSAASLVILVGSVARSRRFRTQLLDAASSLVVGPPDDPQTQMGPLVAPASGKLLDGLTTLDEGEHWSLAPRRLDAAGQQWTPGIRSGVVRGSTSHRVEYFGPVLSVMTAETLDDAINIANDIDYGLTAGIQSLDPAEITTWIRRIQAGNLYVNRGITGAIVQRQPFGGWKKSAVGPGTKAGGPSYLLGLGSWEPSEATATDLVTDPAVARVLGAARAEVAITASGVSADPAAPSLTADDVASLERAAASDAAAWSTVYGTSADVSALASERNVFRHRPVMDAVLVRRAADEPLVDLLRVVVAAAAAGAPVIVSSATALPSQVLVAVRAVARRLYIEDDSAWAARAARRGGGRIRLLGPSGMDAVAAATGGRPDVAVWAHPVTESGRVEMLPFLREQAVSITAHRFGTPNHLTDEVL